MKSIGYLRKKVADIYNLQISAKQNIDVRDSASLRNDMICLKSIADDVLEELESQKEG